MPSAEIGGLSFDQPKEGWKVVLIAALGSFDLSWVIQLYQPCPLKLAAKQLL